jgi:hypothetical protein
MTALRVVLDERRFRRLVAGEVVSAAAGGERVELILSDIGWTAMLRAVCDAIEPPPDPPEAREFLPNEFTRERQG